MSHMSNSTVCFFASSIYTAVQPLSNDILVTRDGTVTYAIQMYITVVCDMNLFTFPFVDDTCVVAINGWNRSCKKQFFNLIPVVCPVLQDTISS